MGRAARPGCGRQTRIQGDHRTRLQLRGHRRTVCHRPEVLLAHQRHLQALARARLSGSRTRDPLGAHWPVDAHPLETRLQCETGQRPPPGHPQDVDFQTFVLSQTHAEASWAIMSRLGHETVRSFAESCAPLDDGDPKIEVCRRMVEAQPRNPEALRQYVLALARFYRARDPWKPLSELFALEGERPSTYGEVGAAMLGARQFDDARKLFERATALWPADPTMPYHLGRAHLGLHAFGPAADAFAVAVRLDSTLADAHAYSAVALAQLGRLDDSRRHCAIATRYLEAALVDRVADVDAWLGLAYCAGIVARDREAVSCFERALAIDASGARATPELVDVIKTSYGAVGRQPPAPLPQRP